MSRTGPFDLRGCSTVVTAEIGSPRVLVDLYDKGSGGAYSFSGGLHGVGVSVTNALAQRLQVQVWRERQSATLTFSGGDVIEPLQLRPVMPGERRQGTAVRVWPDPRYFESAELPRHEGLAFPSQVNYVGKGGRLYDLGYELNGSIAPGVYLVNVTVDGHLNTERLVVQ